MNSYKRILSLSLAILILLCSFASCTSNKKAPNETGSSAAGESTPNESKSVTVNGISIEDIKISVKKKTESEYAQKIQKALEKYNGYSVPIVSQSELAGDEKLVICVGSFDRVKDNPLSSAYNGYRIAVSDKDGLTVGIVGSNDTYLREAADRFVSELFVQEEENSVSITLPSETIGEYKYTFDYGESAKWKMDPSQTVENTLSDGLIYKEYHYTDGEDDKYIANVLYVDTSKYSFYLGLPKDGTSLQTLTEQMQNAQGAGEKVIAGINGDRWDTWLGTGRIHGLSIQDGKLIDRGLWDGGQHNGQSLGDKPYFALTKSGEYVIGAKAGSAKTADILMAIGGDYILVDKAVPQKNSDFRKYQPTDEKHLTSYHPRSLVGIDDRGDLILVTVDGRQEHSNGASLECAADLMASLGCYSAVSLDGGGSTEMIVVENGNYVTKNKPSDGKPRAVKNTLLIVEK